MADSKISALTAITTLTPATDVLPVVDVTGTTKKITTNQILGSGGTATLASATITGDLTVDTSTLKVDSTNDRVGIGTATPAAGYKLDVAGTVSISGGTSNARRLQFNASGAYANWIEADGVAGANYLRFAAGNAEVMRIDLAGVCNWYDGAGGTRMTLNSTGLGVGTGPSYNIDVLGATLPTIAARATSAGASNARFYLECAGTNSGNITYNRSLQALQLGANGPTSAQVTLDSTGNVGVGVTPAAAVAGNTKLQITGSNNSAVVLGTNSVNASARNWAVIANWNAFGDLVFQQSNALGGDPLASGAGTSRMTLDASGNLLVGATSAGGNRLNVQTTSGDCLILVKSQASNANLAIDYVSNYGNHSIRKSGTAVWDYGVISDSSATPAFKIQNASSVGVQLVSGATAWTTLSDETMKDIIEPISNAVAKVGSLRSVIGKFKTDSEGTRRSFLIAQDVQSVLPEAVDVVGENNELGLRYTEVIPLLVAAIKELSAEVNALKNA